LRRASTLYFTRLHTGQQAALYAIRMVQRLIGLESRLSSLK